MLFLKNIFKAIGASQCRTGGGDIAVIIHVCEDQSGWRVEDEYGGS